MRWGASSADNGVLLAPLAFGRPLVLTWLATPGRRWGVFPPAASRGHMGTEWTVGDGDGALVVERGVTGTHFLCM